MNLLLLVLSENAGAHDELVLNAYMTGAMIADVITTFGQINMIGGECDR